MNPLPSIYECNLWILEQCQTILSFIEKGNFDIKELVQATFENAKLLIDALDISKKDKSRLLTKLERYAKYKQSNHTMKLLILSIKEICCQFTQNLSVASSNFYQEPIPNDHQPINYKALWPDQLDEKAFWFRNHFVGKPYITLIGPMTTDQDDLAIISIVKEYAQYRIIIRTKQDMNMGFIVDESDTNDLILQLELSNRLCLLDLESIKKSRPLRSISSVIITSMVHQNYHSPQYESTKWMRASLLFLFQGLKLCFFKELSAEATIICGLEKEFLRYDEIGVPKYYKFGVLTVRQGQTTEEEWFSNSELSIGLEKFMDTMGEPVRLKNYKGYAAGLDTKTGESGEMSYVSRWRDHEIMYHVAPLMPSRQHDIQQIHRKRYIGNDIVCIVFVEGENQKFDPSSIRSQLLHVFIIVHWQVIHGQDTWRIEVLYDKHVKPFSPALPNPPIFYHQKDLQEYLLLKLINAENASLKTDKFMVPNNRARQSVLKSLVETGLQANQVTRSFSGGRLAEKANKHNERPKSAGSTIRTTKPITQQNAHTTTPSPPPPPSPSPPPPPIPTISRSSVLRDLKSLTRRKSQHQVKQPVINQQDKERKKGPITSTSIVATTGIRYKAQNLMSIIGRKNSRTGVPPQRAATSS